MILNTLYTAIQNRLKADTGSGGLYNGNAWNFITGAYAIYATPNGIAYPYLVYNLNMQAANTATGDEFTVFVDFTLFTNTNEQDDATNFGSSATAIMDRLHGDAVLQSGRIPTYGFNRHKLVLPTNGYSAKASDCTVLGYTPAIIDERVVGVTMNMKFWVAAIAANP